MSGVREIVRLSRTIISAIKHSVASRWLSSLRLYNDARTNIHQSLMYNSLIYHSSYIHIKYIRQQYVINLKHVNILSLK